MITRRPPVRFLRLYLLVGFALALTWAQIQDPLRPAFAAHLEIAVSEAGSGRIAARVYLLKDGKPFRLSPVDSLLPLKPDLFYRERLWRQTSRPKTLEVTAID